MNKINNYIAGKIMNTVFEQATVCAKSDGYGIIIKVNSDDHKPYHAHVYDTSMTFRGKLLLTNEIPNSRDDIQEYVYGYDKPLFTSEIKRKILDWANDNDKDTGFNNWKYAWMTFKTYEKDK